LAQHYWGLLGSSPIPPSFVTSCVSFQLRPLLSLGSTRLHRYYKPLRHPRRPGLALTSCQLTAFRAITAGVSRVTSGRLCLHAVAYPGRTDGIVRSYSPIDRGLPRIYGGSAPALFFSRPAQRSLPLQPALLAESPSRATGWSEPVPRGISPLWTTAFQGARKYLNNVVEQRPSRFEKASLASERLPILRDGVAKVTANRGGAHDSEGTNQMGVQT
jgi:hypothetical protein